MNTTPSPLLLTLPEMRGEIMSHLPLQAVFALARTCWALAKELAPAMRTHFEELLFCFGDLPDVQQFSKFNRPLSLDARNSIRTILCDTMNGLQLAELFRSLCRHVARRMWRQLVFFIDGVRKDFPIASFVDDDSTEDIFTLYVCVIGDKVNSSTFIDFMPNFNHGINAQEDKRLRAIFLQNEAHPVLDWPTNLEKQELGTRLYKYIKTLLTYRSPFTILDIDGSAENDGRYSWRSEITFGNGVFQYFDSDSDLLSDE